MYIVTERLILLLEFSNYILENTMTYLISTSKYCEAMV